MVLGIGVYAPMLRGQIRSLDEAGPDSEEFRRYSANARFVGILVAVIVVGIVFLMVTKPTPGP